LIGRALRRIAAGSVTAFPWGRAAQAPGVLCVRAARVDDLDDLCRLVDYWADQGENLPRSRDEGLPGRSSQMDWLMGESGSRRPDGA
jgi:hypothetical protein